jgi:hypothetical protein
MKAARDDQYYTVHTAHERGRLEVPCRPAAPGVAVSYTRLGRGQADRLAFDPHLGFYTERASLQDSGRYNCSYSRWGPSSRWTAGPRSRPGPGPGPAAVDHDTQLVSIRVTRESHTSHVPRPVPRPTSHILSHVCATLTRLVIVPTALFTRPAHRAGAWSEKSVCECLSGSVCSYSI